MGSFAGSFRCRTAVEVQFRLFSIPWIKRNTVVGCLRSREYCSSFPVRYIPKPSSNAKEAQPSSPLDIKENEKDNCTVGNLMRGEVLNDKEHDNSPINNFSVTFKQGCEEVEEGDNHESGFSNNESMEALVKVVEELGILSVSEEQVNMSEGKAKKGVEIVATEILALRACSAADLRKKLHGKRFPLDIVDATITKFQRRGLINDSLYAEVFSRSRWSSSGWGPRRIKQALLKKGVGATEAEYAIKLIFEENETRVDKDLIHGLSKLSMDNLVIKASKQWLRGHDVPRDMRKSRIIRWLQYRGFDWGVTNFVVKKLESDYPL